jgi:threonine synthase
MIQALIERYRSFLPISENTPIISLGEGNTPLVKASHLSKTLGINDCSIYFKLEGSNPTGSFKDRGMTMAISKAKEEGAQGVICASTGNTSASAAAFAAKAGLPCYVLLPAGHVALGKLAQAVLYGAKVIPIEGNFDQALTLVKEIAQEAKLTIVNSINPYRLEGQKTAAFEIIESLGQAPDYLFIPVGNAGNISAYWRGFKQWQQQGRVSNHPKMCGFEAEGAAAIVKGEVISEPETKATAIRIGNPASWKEAESAASESGGLINFVTDQEIFAAYKLLATTEGIFCEPSSAASLAGLIKWLQSNKMPDSSTIVCVLTGNGLKDPDNALASANVELKPIKAELEALRQMLKTGSLSKA